MIIEGMIATHKKTFFGQINIDEDSGIIKAVGTDLGKANISLDKDHRIFPGFIDIHVHCREGISQKQSYKEDFLTASQAAINGGVVGMMDMPNNPSPPIDDNSYEKKKALTKKALVDVLLYAGIGPHTKPLSFPVPYKAYMGPSVGDLFFDKDEKIDKVIPMYKNNWIAFHCESADLLKEHEKEDTHEKQRPQICEVNAIKHAINVCKPNNIRMNVAHLSTKEGLQAVLDAKKAGMTVTCEICQHHLFFDEINKLKTINPKFMQMNPPLRKGEDKRFLLDELKKGNVDYLGTDHAPHTLEENEKGISGLPLLDTYGVFVTWLMQMGVDEQTIAKVCSYNPGKIFSEFKQEKFGEVEKDFVGSLTILNLAKPYTVKREDIKSKCGWSPFEGITFPGSVAMTVVRGKVYSKK